MTLKRYWFKFNVRISDSIPPGILPGCGVTAYHYEDAINILRSVVFNDAPLSEIKQVIKDVDISSLDEKHILPNMANPLQRGVWFPLGYR